MGMRLVVNGWAFQHMQLFKRLCPPILLVAFLVEAGFPQCHQTVAAPSTQESERDNRMVFVALKVNKSGAVRDAKALSGPPSLKAAAIEAAKARKYPDLTPWYGALKIEVAVEFPQDGSGAPKIRPALSDGESSCISSQPIEYHPPPLPASLNLLLHLQPIMPVLAPEN
jgi:hypothetical protein